MPKPSFFYNVSNICQPFSCINLHPSSCSRIRPFPSSFPPCRWQKSPFPETQILKGDSLCLWRKQVNQKRNMRSALSKHRPDQTQSLALPVANCNLSWQALDTKARHSKLPGICIFHAQNCQNCLSTRRKLNHTILRSTANLVYIRGTDL